MWTFSEGALKLFIVRRAASVGCVIIVVHSCCVRRCESFHERANAPVGIGLDSSNYATDGNITVCNRCKLSAWYLYKTIYGCSRCHFAHELLCGVLAFYLSSSLELFNMWIIRDFCVQIEKVSQSKLWELYIDYWPASFMSLEAQWITYLHTCITIHRWR